ncbi:AAA family ATPase [Roseomonas elaeocarpi]|uniref:AAA family ATPase n=1 Tax=Roseomonas elaeocarpi TaxID=907779 RepID=A0ABV6JW61_9PROT
MAAITSIDIINLNGRSDVYLEFQGRHCIIVGPNGTGKSTALQITAYALGRQWRELANLRFDSIEFSFSNGQTASVTRNACLAFTRAPGRPSRYNPINRVLNELGIFTNFIVADLENQETVQKYSHMSGFSIPELKASQRSFRSSSDDKDAQREILAFTSQLRLQEVPPTLYLPTYRRIELELERVLGAIPDYYRSQAAKQAKTGISTEFLIELIKFGMEDVSSAIQAFERETRDFARNRFNRMMTSYLKEMANSRSLSVGDLRSHRIDAKTIEVVLSRIEEGLLSTKEKKQISDIILELSAGPGAGNQPFNKKWLAHFFVRLLEVNTEIEDKEAPIREFAISLEKYFLPKAVSYDIEKYHLSIQEAGGENLELSDLSLGEKQLVSILSQLYLQSENKRFNVLIDEPELSLSVPWQSELIPDIVAAPACNQLIAVTHSPFVYDNNMASMVVDFDPQPSEH